MAKNIFNSVKMADVPSSVFDLTHDVKLSMRMGNLVPILVLDCFPGDKIRLGCETVMRVAPMLAPVMHRIDYTVHYYFVPRRLVWPNWGNYFTNTKDDDTDLLPAFPIINYSSALSTSKLADYMGLPEPFGTNVIPISAIPFASYQMIINDYYRDQNLIDPIDFELVDGDNTAAWLTLSKMHKRAWEHDYFTAALPEAQKGQAVDLPVGTFTDVPVMGTQVNPPDTGVTLQGLGQPSGLTVGQLVPYGTPDDPSIPSNLWADTSGLVLEATTINDLRKAFRLQEWLEKNARGGTRDIEMIRAHFNVRSSDARLDRPEYITGYKNPVQISEVLSTAWAGADGQPVPQGQMSGHGIAIGHDSGATFYCEEWGYVIGIMSVMPKPAYQQGIPRHWLMINDPTELPWPSFANLGEQEIKNVELFFNHTDPEGTFGYIPRYAEHKYQPNRVAGDFKTTLQYWHLGRIFGSEPNLNQQFIEMDSDTVERIFAVQDPGVDNLYVHILNKITATRKLPKYGIPTF